MPELQENRRALPMHRVGHELPAGRVGIGVNARRVHPAEGLLRDGRRLGNDQARVVRWT